MDDDEIDEFNLSLPGGRGTWGGEVRVRAEGAVYLRLYADLKNGPRQEVSAEMHLADAQRLRNNLNLTKVIMNARAAQRVGKK
jgi:hypothetical protein